MGRRVSKSERDRAKRQVETMKARHGKDFYSRIAKLGTDKIPTKFDSTSGSRAAKIKWEKYYAKKEREQEERSRQGE